MFSITKTLKSFFSAKSLKYFIIYNLMIAPVVLGLYIPYNFLFLKYSSYQALRWLVTAAPMYGLANLILAPWTRFVVRFLDRRLKSGVGKKLEAVEDKIEVLSEKVAALVEEEVGGAGDEQK